MQYQVSKAQSAEYLRLAVHHMTQQDTAFHPVSYAVWYEYASGEHAKLIEEMDALIAREQKLNEKNTSKLFEKYIAKIDDAGAQAIIDRFGQVVADIHHSTSQAGKQTHHFHDALHAWSAEIQQLAPSAQAKLNRMLDHTRDMQGSIHDLQDKLAASAEEMTLLKNEISRARQEALSDGLTGLSNRKGFDAALVKCLHAYESNQTPAAKSACLLIADIDFFKKINDSYGHLFGDKVIKAVAQILLKASHQQTNQLASQPPRLQPTQATAARYGGEEFVLLLPDTPIETAIKIAEDIRKQVERITIKNNLSQTEISNITISLGVTPYLKGESSDAFIARADKALYASKAKGRNQVTVYQEAIAA